MDHRLALGDLAALAVDRDEDRLVQRIGQECGQLLFAASAGIAGLALRETGVQRRPAGAHLVIVLVIRHMHLCYRYFRNVWVSKIVSTYHIRPMIVNKANAIIDHNGAKKMVRPWSVRLSLLAPSEADRPPSEPSLSAPVITFPSL